MRPNPVSLAAFLLTFGVACSSITNVSGAAQSPFAGTWAQREAVAGTSFVFTFAVDGAKVTATGTYLTDGNRSGTVTVTDAALNGETLLLALTYDNGALAQLQGRLESPLVMSGSLHLGPPQALTPSAIVSFDKKK
jgi:hypothetical protein